MNTPNTRQLEILSAGTDTGLKREQLRYSFELFPNRVRRLETIPPPPRV